MGGRGGTSGRTIGSNGRSGLVSKVKDNTDLNAFVRENMSIPEFKQLGRQEGMDAVKDLWFQKRHNEEIKNLHEMSQEDAANILRNNIQQRYYDGWFRSADPSIKPLLMQNILENKGTLNAAMNLAYHNYLNEGGKKMSFDKFLKTPMTMYRGSKNQGSVHSNAFTSFTPNKEIAQKFVGKSGKLIAQKVRPIDTIGSYQTNMEQEYLILTPRKKKK